VDIHTPEQNKGDLWYFPAGIPHSLQGTNATADGTEFLLVFPSGTFNEDDTVRRLLVSPTLFVDGRG
jgi:quercetin dioxygenase-like cupin family protein